MVWGKSSPTDIQGVSTADPKLDLPVVIAEWDRNAREVVRVTLDYFKEHYTINVRIWYHSGRELRPSRSGITLAVKHLPAMAEAIHAALARAQQLGLLNNGGEQ